MSKPKKAPSKQQKVLEKERLKTKKRKGKSRDSLLLKAKTLLKTKKEFVDKGKKHAAKKETQQKINYTKEVKRLEEEEENQHTDSSDSSDTAWYK